MLKAFLRQNIISFGALVVLCVGNAPASAVTAEVTAAVTAETAQVGEDKVLRVGGTYEVTEIDRVDSRTFVVTFTSTAKSGRFDTLKLTSDHVHVSVRRGQQVRLSAEILSEQGATAEVAQLVLFLPSPRGQLPVWLLSNKAPTKDLRATRYLEMHAPLYDFSVM